MPKPKEVHAAKEEGAFLAEWGEIVVQPGRSYEFAIKWNDLAGEDELMSEVRDLLSRGIRFKNLVRARLGITYQTKMNGRSMRVFSEDIEVYDKAKVDTPHRSPKPPEQGAGETSTAPEANTDLSEEGHLKSALRAADLAEGWLGPTVDVIIPDDKPLTALRVVELVQKAIKEDKDARVALRIEVSDKELSKESIRMVLKNIPAIVVLKQVADQCRYEFTFEKGIWVMRNRPVGERRFDDTIVTLKIENCTQDELEALGLQVGKKRRVTVATGKKWPSEEWGSAMLVGDILVLTAYQWEIDCFNAALTLLRFGYHVPLINSEQAEDANAGDAPG